MPEPQALKLVILEDEEAHFHLMQRAITKELPFASIVHFTEASAFLEHIDTLDPDVIIMDYLLPGMNGLELLEELRRKDDRSVPIIMITGQGSEHVAVDAMRLGAWDYLVKSLDFFKLLPVTIDKVIRRRNLKKSLEESALFNQLLMDSLPHPAMLIRKDKIILAANRAAREAGAKIGGYCWRDFAHAGYIAEAYKHHWNDADCPVFDGMRCTFCLGDEALAQRRPMNAPEVKAFGRIWDTWWIPVEDDIYFHYTLDITERKQAEQVIQASHRFLKIANKHSELLPLLEEFLSELKRFADCSAVGIRLLDKSGHVPYLVHEGFSQSFYEQENLLSLQSNRCLCIEVLKGTLDSRQLYCTEGGSFHTNHATRLVESLLGEDRVRIYSVCGRFGYESVVLIPVRIGMRTIGLVHLADTREERFPQTMIETLERAAIQLGTAIQRVQSENALRESEKELRFLASRLMAAQEEERKRIAGELHDNLGSSLIALKMSLENVQRTMDFEEAEPNPLDVPISWVRHAVSEIRKLMSDLRPSLLDDLGLIITIGWLCKQFRATYPHIAIEENIDLNEADLPEPLKIVIFRIIQEAFTNAAKHSSAPLITLTLSKNEEAIELSCEDHGKGFDLEAVLSSRNGKKGLGLTSMKERTELSGGLFSIRSAPDEGTTIRASWPLEKLSG